MLTLAHARETGVCHPADAAALRRLERAKRRAQADTGIPRDAQPDFEHETVGAAARVKRPFSARSMRTLLVMIGAWSVLNAFLVVATINDKLRSWVSYLFCTSIVIGLVISEGLFSF